MTQLVQGEFDWVETNHRVGISIADIVVLKRNYTIASLCPDEKAAAESMLAVVQRAADGGNVDAAAWLRGEGRMVAKSELEVKFVRWEELQGRWSSEALQWSKDVMRRDGFRCRECGAKGKLHAHHIQGWATHPDLRFDLDNGVTLCVECHALKHPGRENLIRKARYCKRRGQ